jgi:hypothetical protein
VESRDDYIFAASGREGMYIIKLNKPDESLATRCLSSPLYWGSSKLRVDEGETLEYSGAKRFSSVDVKGALLLCGAWTVSGDVKVDDDALFEMNGTFAVGSNRKQKDITVEKGATFRVEGNLLIYGDLILKENATLEFIGPVSVADIFGEVKMEDSAKVIGTYVDVQDKF